MADKNLNNNDDGDDEDDYNDNNYHDTYLNDTRPVNLVL